MTLEYTLNLMGVGVFAVSGALAAGRKNLDLLGVVVISVVTAIGGGTVRDLLLDRHPIFWIEETENLLVILGAAVFTLVYVRFRDPPERALLIADACGLAVFTISGTRLAEVAGVGGMIAVIMGVITGVVGGMMRDILTAEIPLILRRSNLYATAAIAGATVYLMLKAMGASQSVAGLTGMGAVILLRLAAITRDIRLPAITVPEEGRTRNGRP